MLGVLGNKSAHWLLLKVPHSDYFDFLILFADRCLIKAVIVMRMLCVVTIDVKYVVTRVM